MVQVESAIFSHGDVAECAVFGVPDDRLGEEVAAASGKFLKRDLRDSLQLSDAR